MIYFDNAATMPVLPEVADVIDETMRTVYGNPSSLHSLGMKANQILEESRETIANYLGCKPSEFYFTGSGTESNNIAIRGVLNRHLSEHETAEVFLGKYEHPSVTNTVLSYGNSVKLVDEATEETALFTVMQINNETGENIYSQGWTFENPRHIHVDGVQGLGKVYHNDSEHWSPVEAAIDSYSISAHKIGGPKGIGGLYVREGSLLDPVITGGGQENALRAGTENIPYTVGFAKAIKRLKIYGDKDYRRTNALASRLVAELETIKGVHINGVGSNIVNFSIPGISSIKSVLYLSSAGFCVSGGSACNKGERSHTLTAMGFPDEIIDSAIRVSFGWQNSPYEVDLFVKELKKMIRFLGIRG